MFLIVFSQFRDTVSIKNFVSGDNPLVIFLLFSDFRHTFLQSYRVQYKRPNSQNAKKLKRTKNYLNKKIWPKSTVRSNVIWPNEFSTL